MGIRAQKIVGLGMSVGLLMITGAAFGQAGNASAAGSGSEAASKPIAASKPAFEVASVRPAAVPDQAKMIADLQAGKRPNSARIDASRATYTYNSLKELIAGAYKVRMYQVNGPEWLLTDRFDIAAKMPDGASRDDVPAMLQTLLEERFKLQAHRETAMHPVLALTVAKGGPKLQESTAATAVVEDDAPLRPGESKMDTMDGPIRVLRSSDGSTTYNLGARGSFKLHFDGETRTMHLTSDGMNMKGLALMMTSLGGGDGRPVVDQTELTGKYSVEVEFSIADLMASLRDQGIDLPQGPGGARGGAGMGEASEPGGGATLAQALQKLGLKMERSKAMIEQVIVDHIEKMPTEN